MKTIRLINFIDVCSYSLLKVLDDTIAKVYINDGKILVDFNDSHTKKLFKYLFEQHLNQYTQFGIKNIIINTCRPYDNWRKEDRKRAIKSVKYKINDDSIEISNSILQYQIDKLWDILLKDTNYFTINNKELDTFDLIRIINDLVGQDHISYKNPSYLILIDGNNEYIRQLKNDIPQYLIDNIESQLISLKILT